MLQVNYVINIIFTIKEYDWIKDSPIKWPNLIDPAPIDSQYMLIKSGIGLKFALNYLRGKYWRYLKNKDVENIWDICIFP